MRVIVFVLLSALAANAAAAERARPLDRIFDQFCATSGRDHPACGAESTAASEGYRWLLLRSVCAGAPDAAFCAAFEEVRGANEPCVIAYDHASHEWKGRYALADRRAWALDVDVSGVPTVTAGRSDACVTIVENTVPLVHGVQLGKVEEKDNDLLAGMKTLAALLGDTLHAVAPLMPRPNIFLKAREQQGVAGQMQHPLGGSPTPFETLAVRTWLLVSNLTSIQDATARVGAALNAVETDGTGVVPAIAWSAVDLGAASWHDAFDVLRSARDGAVKSLEGQVPSKEQQTALDQAQKLLDRQPDVAGALAALRIEHARWQRYVVDGRMLTWMLVPLRGQPIGWTHDQVYAFSIVADAPFAGDVVPARAKSDASIRFTSPKSSLFGVGAGLVFTPLEQDTYKAVAGPDGVKRIAVTDRTARTGQLALFLDWRIAQLVHDRARTWRVRPALQFGAALDTKTPGLFAGGSLELVRWLRVSAGRTWQTFPVLSGQQVGDLVKADDAIRTKEAFRPGWYGSVALAIDGLPFFGSK